MSVTWADAPTRSVATVGPFVLTAYRSGCWEIGAFVGPSAFATDWPIGGSIDTAKRDAITALRALCAGVLEQTKEEHTYG